MTTTDAIVVLVTVPADRAEALARTLVEERRCACVNLVPGVRSIYRWEDQVQADPETLCVVKTTRQGFEALKARVLELHPYQVPEVIALPVEAGHAPYLAWLASTVGDGVSGTG